MKAVKSVKDKIKSYNHLIVTDVKRENDNDDRISVCEIYQRVEDKHHEQFWLKCKDQTQAQIVEYILKKWEVQTGKVLDNEDMDIGEDIEIELRVRKNDQKYPLSSMGKL
ncbi:MAG: hypothetical protein ABF727_13190 [Gluconobacter oxydans]